MNALEILGETSNEIINKQLASLNPLTPESDKHLISPFNISPLLHIMGKRIQGIITN